MSKVKQLPLSNLLKSCCCITPEFTALLAQAGVVCLSESGHSDGVILQVTGDFGGKFSIIWPYDVTNSMLKTWTEQNYTTDHAACGIAILLVSELTNLTVISRSWTTTGFDYWLGPKDTPCDTDLPFDDAIRLEISGIYRGNRQSIRYRVKKKLKQTQQSDHLGLPAYVIVVEFSKPESSFIEKRL